MIVCCFVVYSTLCKIRANRCESAGTMLIFLFSRSVPGTREAHLERPQGFWNGLRLLEQSLWLYLKLPSGLFVYCSLAGRDKSLYYLRLNPPSGLWNAVCGLWNCPRAIQQTSLLFRGNRWSGNRLRRGGLSSRLGHRLRRELRRLCESLWGLDARGNTG